MTHPFYVGEALDGKGNEIAHIDLLLGSKDGPVGNAFASALARQTAGHTNLLSVLTPNLAIKPSTLTFTKVTIKGAKQAVQMFGPAQAAVAWGVTDEVQAGTLKELGSLDDLVIICGVFIHWEAKDDELIFRYNYLSVRKALRNAVDCLPTPDEIQKKIADLGCANHPFKGDFDLSTALKELRASFA